MTVEEFSNEFDVEYNNVMSDMAPGLDDYEKSVFLTRAQEEIVLQLYGGTLADGFESSEINRRDIDNLLGKMSYTPASPSTVGIFKEYSFSLPNALMVLIREQATAKDLPCKDQNKIVNVVPTKFDELNKVLNDPFRRPNNNKVIRVDSSTFDVRIISKYELVDYTIEYLRKPSPIILCDLPNELSINGISTKQTCALHEPLHRKILKYAVQLAAVSWASNNKS